MIQIPPADYVPAGPERAVAVAHAAQEVLSDIAHAMRHAGAVAAAQKAGNPERVKFNLFHNANHVSGAIRQQNSSISNLVQLDPRAGDELEKLRDTAAPSRIAATGLCPVPGCVICVRSASSSWEYAPPGPTRGKTPAHLAQTVLVALTHARQHTLACQAAKDAENMTFDLEHDISHLAEAHSHQVKYIGAVAEFFPAVAAELGALGELADVGGIIKAPQRSAQSGTERGVLPIAGQRCNYCGELSPCIDLECPGSGDARQSAQARAYEATAAQFAAGSRWGGAI